MNRLKRLSILSGVGSKVSSKQAIGSLLADDSGVSICHFEIHSVAGGMTKSLNPSLWIGR